jgi:cell division protein ZipA
MDSLRWALLAAGVLVVVGIYLWEVSRRRARKLDQDLDEADRALLEGLSARRDEDPFADLGGLRADPLRLDADDVAQLGSMVPDAKAPAPGAEPGRRLEPALEIDLEPEPEPELEPRAPTADRKRRLYSVEERKPRTGEELIIVLNVMAEPGAAFNGAEVRSALESVDMRFGEMKVFHHYGIGDTRSETAVFSVANMIEPGVFDLAGMDGMKTPGLVMFMRLPGPLDARVAFELMLNTGQRLAEDLGGELRDETRSVLSAQTIAHVRERITEFNRRQLLAAS